MEIEKRPITHRVKDITGKRFNAWTVIGYYGRRRYGYSHAQIWECRCVCGEVSLVDGSSLKSGTSKQCERCGKGEPGGQFHPLYSTWLGMKGRCHNPNHVDYSLYGARGIEVCPEWRRSFSAFSDYVDTVLGTKPEGFTLDRIDNERGYAPGNVRWSDHSTQMKNRRPWRKRNLSLTP